MENILICAVLISIVLSSGWYLIRAKRNGQKCIGCPYGKQCQGACGSKIKA